MKKLLFLASLITIAFGCGSLSSKQQVLLVGAVHEPTAEVNTDTIYKLLTRFKPDLILIELDSTFFNPDFTFKNLFDGNEITASVRYKMNFPKSQIRPIEFTGREEYRTSIGVFPEITPEFGNIMQSLASENQLTPRHQRIISRLFHYDKIVNDLKSASLRVLNSKKADTSVDSLNYYKYASLKEISETYPQFTRTMVDSKGDTVSVRENFARYVHFEAYQRNEAMSRNSITYIRNNPGKRIVILVGSAHRPYILRELREQGIAVLELTEVLR